MIRTASPADEARAESTRAFHDISAAFWNDLTPAQQAELHAEADEPADHAARAIAEHNAERIAPYAVAWTLAP